MIVQLAQLLAIVALIALALAIVIVVRRAVRLIADTRATTRFRVEVAGLTAPIDETLGAVAGRVDAVRRHTVGAQEVTDDVVAAREAVARHDTEAQALTGPAGTTEIRDAILAELERAARALEMVEHGCTILSAPRVGSREMEAQVAIKRGYLNILHAREAIARHATRAAAMGKGEHRGLFERRV